MELAVGHSPAGAAGVALLEEGSLALAVEQDESLTAAKKKKNSQSRRAEKRDASRLTRLSMRT